MLPKLKLLVDVKADIENACYFVKQGEFVERFLPKELHYILTSHFRRQEQNKIIGDYARQIYRKHEKPILQSVSDTRKRWNKVKSKFFALVAEIFPGLEWPEGKYIGYASIFQMYPRDISDKTFFFPAHLSRWDPVQTIAHEMLHFIFFEYIRKQYRIRENTELKGKNPRYVWRVSETFNTVLENWAPYKKIFGAKTNVKPYPECQKMYEKMRREWAANRASGQDIRIFLDRWLQK